MSKDVTPDYNYLDQKLSVSSAESLEDVVLQKLESLDMELMAKDVEPFLFDASDLKKVINFEDVLTQYSL
jgi:hypothetical protein